jgi:hypothetical protein
VYFDFGGRKNLIEPVVCGSVDRRRTKEGESDILFTPNRRTGDFLSSSSGRSLERKRRELNDLQRLALSLQLCNNLNISF